MTALEKQFAQTVAEHKSTIYTVCYMFSQDADEVNDLFQEVLVNLWKGFESFEHRSDPRTWIYRVALNTCISLDRKKKRRTSTVRLTMDINLFEDRDEDTRQVDMLHKPVSALCLLMIPYGYWAFVKLNGMSVGFWAATSILMIIAFVYTFINGKYLRNKDLLNDDLLVARQKIAHAMKLDHQWLKIGIPLAILWVCYFCYESFRIKELVNDGLTMCYLGIICGAIGAAIGLSMHFKTQRQYQDIIDQIEDLTAEG